MNRMPHVILFIFSISYSVYAATPVENEQLIAKVFGEKYKSAADWGMAPIRTKNNYEIDEAKHTIVLRSTGEGTDAGSSGMLAFQARELARKGFCAVGPNYVIDQEGFVYACRGLGFKPAVSVPNTGVIGVTLMGAFHGKTAPSMTPKARDSLGILLFVLSRLYDIPLSNAHIIPVSARNTPHLPDMPGDKVVADMPHILEYATRWKESRVADYLDGKIEEL